jgi:uncharacterized protein
VTPEPPSEELLPPPPPPPSSPPDTYPFWSYLDLLGFFLIALVGIVAESLLVSAITAATHIKQAYLLIPAQVLLYAFLLGGLALIFRRYYGRPFWSSLHWQPGPLRVSTSISWGILVAFVVMLSSIAMRTPDVNSPMKALLEDPVSVVMIAIIGTTLAPLCEEIIFRGFLQPLLVRSFGAAPGILVAAAAFGLMHLQEYGNSWRHALLIGAAGASFGWMRYRSGSTKAAVLMHAAYNGVFFVGLAAGQLASHGR